MSLRFDIDEIQSEVERLIRRCPIGNLIEIAEELKIFNVDLESPIKIRRLIAEAFDEIESPQDKITLFASLHSFLPDIKTNFNKPSQFNMF